MTISNINVYVNKIRMVRPGKNPKNYDLDLNLDWSIDYIKTDKKALEYVCTLSKVDKPPLDFAIQGLIECEDQNKDLEKRSDELSPLILEKSMETMINMLNETKDTKIPIKTIPEVYLTDISERTPKNGRVEQQIFY